MKLSESIQPCDYCPVTLSEYNQAVMHVGMLKRQGLAEEAEKAELAAREIRRRLIGGEK